MRPSALAAVALGVVACSSSSSGDGATSEGGAPDATAYDTTTGPDSSSGVDATTDGAGTDAKGDVSAADASDAGDAADAPSFPDAPPPLGARCDTGSGKIYAAGDYHVRGAFASLYFYVPLPDGGSEEHFCYDNSAPSNCECSVAGTCVQPNACPPGAPCGVTMADGIPGNVRTGSCF